MAYDPAASALDFALADGYGEYSGGHIDFPNAPNLVAFAGSASIVAGASAGLGIGKRFAATARIAAGASAGLTRYPPDGAALDFALKWGFQPPDGGAVDFPGALLPGEGLPTADATVAVSAAAGLSIGKRFAAAPTVTVGTEAEFTARNLGAEATVGISAVANLSIVYFVGAATVAVRAYPLGLNPQLPLATGVNGPVVALSYNDAPPKELSLAGRHQVARQINTATVSSWGIPSKTDPERSSGWQLAKRQDSETAGAWGLTASIIQPRKRAAWEKLFPRDREQSSAWPDDLVPRDVEDGDSWVWLIPRDREQEAPHELVDPFAEPYDKEPLYAPPEGARVSFSAEPADYSSSARALDFVMRPPKPNRRAVATNRCSWILPWQRGRERDAITAYPWDPAISRSSRPVSIPEPPPPPIETDPHAPPILASYAIMPSIEIVRLPDRTPVPALAATVRTDRASWAWSCILALATRDALDLVMPDPQSGPYTVEITINGYRWECLIEGYRIDRAFGRHTFQATGRGKAALLAAPYAPRASYTEDAPRTAAQLAADPLQNTGWTLNWTAPDWPVPAGVFSYQDLTPLEVVTRVAGAVGATVSSHATDSVLTVASAYPYTPWGAPAQVDAVLPTHVLMRLGEDWDPGPAYDTIYCAGANQGVLVKATITGSGGTHPAPMLTDPLITDVAAGRERGRTELCRGGNKTRASCSLPLYPAPESPGLILPGGVCEVGEGADTWYGLADSVQITASRTSALSVRQALTLERHH